MTKNGYCRIVAHVTTDEAEAIKLTALLAGKDHQEWLAEAARAAMRLGKLCRPIASTLLDRNCQLLTMLNELEAKIEQGKGKPQISNMSDDLDWDWGQP
jgi:hypothetical protein